MCWGRCIYLFSSIESLHQSLDIYWQSRDWYFSCQTNHFTRCFQTSSMIHHFLLIEKNDFFLSTQLQWLSRSPWNGMSNRKISKHWSKVWKEKMTLLMWPWYVRMVSGSRLTKWFSRLKPCLSNSWLPKYWPTTWQNYLRKIIFCIVAPKKNLGQKPNANPTWRSLLNWDSWKEQKKRHFSISNPPGGPVMSQKNEIT